MQYYFNSYISLLLLQDKLIPQELVFACVAVDNPAEMFAQQESPTKNVTGIINIDDR